jgi:hypothetical protein
MTEEATDPPADTLEQVQLERFRALKDEQIVRLHMFELMADADIRGDILVENLDIAYHWVMTGKIKKSKPQLVDK